MRVAVFIWTIPHAPAINVYRCHLCRATVKPLRWYATIFFQFYSKITVVQLAEVCQFLGAFFPQIPYVDFFNGPAILYAVAHMSWLRVMSYFKSNHKHTRDKNEPYRHRRRPAAAPAGHTCLECSQCQGSPRHSWPHQRQHRYNLINKNINRSINKLNKIPN